MIDAPELFLAIARGDRVPRVCPYVWVHARTALGQSVLHIAAANGRYDALWTILTQYPALAAEPDFELRLPEEVAMSDFGAQLCRQARETIYIHHGAF